VVGIYIQKNTGKVLGRLTPESGPKGSGLSFKMFVFFSILPGFRTSATFQNTFRIYWMMLGVIYVCQEDISFHLRNVLDVREGGDSKNITVFILFSTLTMTCFGYCGSSSGHKIIYIYISNLTLYIEKIFLTQYVYSNLRDLVESLEYAHKIHFSTTNIYWRI